MKKLVSLFVAMAFAIGVAGCGNSNEAQIQAATDVVSGYLDAIQNGNLDGAKEYTTDSYIDPLGIDNMDSYMESLLDSLDIGDTFDHIDGKDYENIDFTAMESELTTYTQNYANENLNRLMQIYNDQGEDAMMEAMMQDIGGYMFDRMETLFTGAEQKKYQMRFDLVQDENEWKIKAAEISEEAQS